MTKVTRVSNVIPIGDKKRKRPSKDDFKGYVPPKNGA